MSPRAETQKLIAALAVAKSGLREVPDGQTGTSVRVRTHYADKPSADTNYIGDYKQDDAYVLAGRLAAELGGVVEWRTRYSLLVSWGRQGQYLSIPQVADRTGLAETTIRTYKTKGKMPAPDALIGGVPGWLVETIDEWKATLPGQGSRTDLHEGQTG